MTDQNPKPGTDDKRVTQPWTGTQMERRYWLTPKAYAALAKIERA